MTLEEKFKDVIEDAITHDQQYDSFEQIADDFAIGFGEWISNNRLNLVMHQTELLWHHSNVEMWITTKEILEIYIKEKGL